MGTGVDGSIQLFLVSPKASKPKEKPILSDEVRARLEQASASFPFLAVLYYLGLRLGEAAGLRWGDFDWRARMVHVQRKLDYHDHAEPGDTRTEKSDRFVPIPDALCSILYPLRQLPDMYLFHGDNNSELKADAAHKLWLDAMTAAGLTYKKMYTRKDRGREITITKTLAEFSPHTLRHNYVTMCIEHGIDSYTLSRLAGHTNIGTTLNIYTHMTQHQLDQARADINTLFQNKSCTKVAQPTPPTTT